MACSRDEAGESIFHLTTQLTEKLVQESNHISSGKKLSSLVKKARSSIYETLLGKKHVKEISKMTERFELMSPVSHLISQRFVLHNAGDDELSEELDNIISEVLKLGWQNEPDPILKTLVCLSNSPASSELECPTYEPFYLSRKLGFAGHMPEQSSRVYPFISPDIFRPPPWMNVKHKVSPFGSCSTSLSFSKEPGENLPLLEIFCGTLSKRELSDSCHYQLHPIPPLTGPWELTSASDVSDINVEDEGYVTPLTELANLSDDVPENDDDPTQVWSEALEVRLPQLKSWETLGRLVTPTEPPFLSTADPESLPNLSILVNLYRDVNTNYISDPLPTSRDDFVRDLLQLLIGIESSNFLINEETDEFVLRNGLWLEGYCVDDTSTLCQDFLFCGTHFRRLEKLCNSLNPTKEHGLIIQSLHDFVQRWIQFYRGSVMILSAHVKLQDHPILLYELLEYVQNLKQQVACLSRLCHVSGPSNSSPLPGGVALLAHMYREACMSNCLQSNLLYSALKSCCEVYLRCLQRWIFLGDCLDDGKNEFFVFRDPNFSSRRDRSFWTRGFVLDKKAVPDFLQGLEWAIYDCGRAMNLLKVCSPQHPLCVLLGKKHPAINCCLFKSDMVKVQKDCAEFEKEAQIICKNLMNVSKLFEEEKDKKAHLHILMKKVQRERIIARELMRMKVEKQRAERKEKQNAEMKAQILAIQQRRAEEKEQKRIEDEQYLLECKRLDDAARIMEEKERKKVIAHYEELGKIVDKQNRHREWQLKRLKMSEKRQAFLYEDSLNLSKECKLLSQDSWTVKNTKTDDVHAIESDLLSLTSGSNVVDVPSPTAILSSPKVDVSVVALPEQANTLIETRVTKDLFKEASAIKAKVLQIEFGLGPNNSNSLERPEKKCMEENPCTTVHSLDGNPSVSSENVLIEIEAPDSTDTATRDETCSIMASEYDFHMRPTDLEKNRHRVLTENDCWAPDDNIVTKPSRDCSDRDRNRLRVLESEYNILTGAKCSNDTSKASTGLHTSQTKPQKSVRSLSEREKNKRKVLNEEYNMLTGERLSHESHTAESISPVVIQSDSGVDIPSSLSGVLESPSNRSFDNNLVNLTQKPKDAPLSASSTRPQILSVSSGASSMTSPLATPHSHLDMPVFTSPFKGTNHLPNELPLASPILEYGSDKPTTFEVQGIPLMVDIVDNFSSELDVHLPTVSGDVGTLKDEVDNAEQSQTMPTASFLESSLQTCLLLPLRVQYRYVSAALLHFFLVDLQLLAHLKSLRSFYFMQDGEFGRHLTFNLFTQLYQVSAPAKLLNPYSLNKVVQEALAVSQSGSDPNHSQLSFSVKDVPQHFSHSSPNVLDCLVLEYKVQWPLNLLLTRDTLEKYNVIFLFLVRLKRVAWLLQEDFVALKNTARGCFKEQNKDLLNSPQYHQVQMIRQSMSQFLQATLNYVGSSVLHASWTDFALSLQQATTLDHIYNAHVEYLKRLLKRCLLNANSKRVEAVLTKILLCIIKFHSLLRVRPWQVASKLQSEDQQSIFFEHPNFQSLLACSTHFKFQVCKLVSYLEKLISPPNQQQHLAEYLLMININGYYKSSDYLKHAGNMNDSDSKSVASSRSIEKDLSHVS